MTRKITITKLKQVDQLEFYIPGPGVYVLSGTNGSGKSSLLACLLRIGWRNAFQLSFKSSKISKQLDEYSGASVKYEVNGLSVSYVYSGERWVPVPKSQSKLLSQFGYGAVIYAAANSERIEPRAEDFKPQRVKDAPIAIREGASKILGDDKFRELKTINLKRGVGSDAYLLQDKLKSTTKRVAYYSEKNFSLGEICVLKLLRQLENCPHGSLVLIDELELALHPKAQVRLFEHLHRISKEKNLTTLFSTHSASLIKSCERPNFYFIDRLEGKTKIISGCYPTYALGQIALTEERSPDVVLYVEDEQAKLIVDRLVGLLISKYFAGKSKPTIVVAPIGTFSAVVAFLTRSQSLLPESVKQFALLDKDVETESLAALRTSKSYLELQKFENVKNKISYLPWTPEVGICSQLRSNIEISQSELREFFNDNRIYLDDIDLGATDSLTGADLRRKCKTMVRELVSSIAQLTVRSDERVRDDISQYFAEKALSGTSEATLTKLLLPMIKA